MWQKQMILSKTSHCTNSSHSALQAENTPKFSPTDIMMQLWGVNMTEKFRPESISLFKKQRFLLQMSEDQFRDEVVRPFFLGKVSKMVETYVGRPKKAKMHSSLRPISWALKKCTSFKRRKARSISLAKQVPI
jgi:hypothetical protein